MTTTMRMTLALGVISVSLFILFSGRTNLRNFDEVQTSAEEIYEDRLVVKGLIFEVASLLHQKEIAQVTGDVAYYQNANADVDDQIDTHLQAFRSTRLTPDEAQTLDRFEDHLHALMVEERALGQKSSIDSTSEEARQLAHRMAELKKDLRSLAEIQLYEGRRRMSIGEKAVVDMYWIAWLETAMLIVFAAVLLLLVYLPSAPAKDG